MKNVLNFNINTCELMLKFYLVCHIPVCKVPDVQNSNLVLSEDHLSVKYSCDIGFSLKGSSERSCLQDGGGWDHTEPKCGRNSLSKHAYAIYSFKNEAF